MLLPDPRIVTVLHAFGCTVRVHLFSQYIAVPNMLTYKILSNVSYLKFCLNGFTKISQKSCRISIKWSFIYYPLCSPIRMLSLYRERNGYTRCVSLLVFPSLKSDSKEESFAIMLCVVKEVFECRCCGTQLWILLSKLICFTTGPVCVLFAQWFWRSFVFLYWFFIFWYGMAVSL